MEFHQVNKNTGNVNNVMVSGKLEATGGAELQIDDETGKTYWSLWGAGWKDGEDMDVGENIIYSPDTFPVGTRIVIMEPPVDSEVSQKFYNELSKLEAKNEIQSRSET